MKNEYEEKDKLKSNIGKLWYNQFLFECIEKNDILSWNAWREDNCEIHLDLIGIDLSEKDLTNINLSNADLSKAKFSGSLLQGAILSNSVIEYCDFFGANCDDMSAHGTSFYTSILCHTFFRNSDLSSCNFCKADMRGADITGANINNSLVTDTNLHDVLCNFIYIDCDWKYQLPRKRYFRIGEIESLLKKAHSANSLTSRLVNHEKKMGYAFVSYVKEDYEIVMKVVEELEINGIDVWIDKTRLEPGIKWQKAIRNAISNGAYFLACFSGNYWNRNMTYMNEELMLARDQIRRRREDVAWFIPIRMSECEIPDLEIGAGLSIRDFHWADLSNNWDNGIAAIINSIKK